MAIVRRIQTTFCFKYGVCSRLSTSIKTRNPLIAFPKRSSIGNKDSVKNNVTHLETSSNPPSFLFPKILTEKVISVGHVTPPQTVYKADGSSILVTESLPLKYKRPLISNEEIEYIMRGGRDC